MRKLSFTVIGIFVLAAVAITFSAKHYYDQRQVLLDRSFKIIESDPWTAATAKAQAREITALKATATNREGADSERAMRPTSKEILNKTKENVETIEDKGNQITLFDNPDNLMKSEFNDSWRRMERNSQLINGYGSEHELFSEALDKLETTVRLRDFGLSGKAYQTGATDEMLVLAKDRLLDAHDKFMRVLMVSTDSKIKIHSIFHLARISDRLWTLYGTNYPATFYIEVIRRGYDDRLTRYAWDGINSLVAFRFGGTAGINEPAAWARFLVDLEKVYKKQVEPSKFGNLDQFIF